ncbi:unnamed protein product [Polarella glacialis]|uniref:Uncharacterized protein n=1 Tax=Polarella glacialis TaxID=89957 RepID=A0A813IWR7_POLGL|nr:unnamed protein product [Polarella glacialis]
MSLGARGFLVSLLPPKMDLFEAARSCREWSRGQFLGALYRFLEELISSALALWVSWLLLTQASQFREEARDNEEQIDFHIVRVQVKSVAELAYICAASMFALDVVERVGLGLLCLPMCFWSLQQQNEESYRVTRVHEATYIDVSYDVWWNYHETADELWWNLRDDCLKSLIDIDLFTIYVVFLSSLQVMPRPVAVGMLLKYLTAILGTSGLLILLRFLGKNLRDGILKEHIPEQDRDSYAEGTEKPKPNNIYRRSQTDKKAVPVLIAQSTLVVFYMVDLWTGVMDEDEQKTEFCDPKVAGFFLAAVLLVPAFGGGVRYGGQEFVDFWYIQRWNESKTSIRFRMVCSMIMDLLANEFIKLLLFFTLPLLLATCEGCLCNDLHRPAGRLCGRRWGSGGQGVEKGGWLPGVLRWVERGRRLCGRR